MKNSEKSFISLLSYVALVIVALLLIVDVLAHFDILTIKGMILSALETIKNICVLVVIGSAAYNFISGKAKWVKVLFWVSIIVLIVGTVLIWL